MQKRSWHERFSEGESYLYNTDQRSMNIKFYARMLGVREFNC